jgi:hypothetical protein
LTLAGGSPLAAVALVLIGLFLLGRGHQAARRRGLLSSTFWLTFREFAGYRARSLYPLLLYVLGLAVLLAGILLAISWLIGFYAGRFGRPLL